ncbi:hypothetical protein EMCRGX_G027350, partial [Ephydatia muelleri]
TSAAIKLGIPSDQRAAIEASGCDVSLPTGSGKSFCYWILPKLFDRRAGGSVVIVVSPLRVNEGPDRSTNKERCYSSVCRSDAILLDRADISNSSYQHCR